MKDYNLNRFILAQQADYICALDEIKAGRKQSHWMWYIFPQLRSLGHSGVAKYYGIADLEEAKAYMEEPFLRENLICITKALLMLDISDPRIVMGSPDDLKLRSCMTLFEVVSPYIPEFGMVLEKFYEGKRDKRTLQLLNMID